MKGIPLIKLRCIGKIYHTNKKNIIALDKIDLDIHEAEFIEDC